MVVAERHGSARNGAILLATGPWDARPWAEAVRRQDPQRPVATWPDIGDGSAIRYAMVWKPPRGALKGLPNLDVIFSLGAGVDHIVLDPDLPDVPIARFVDPDLTMRMTEWVALQVLMHHRRQRAYDRFQSEHRWKEMRQPAAASVRVGIMGLGELGRSAADILVRLGFDVAGWSRRPRTLPDVRCFSGSGNLSAFLARTDILVCLLPLTPETRGILDMELFRRLARDGAIGGPVLINAGRGGLQVEADIVAAIEQGILIGASLDVFEREPLDPASPLWDFDNVVITPHSAAWSDPARLTGLILAQIADYEAGKPLRNAIDRASGY